MGNLPSAAESFFMFHIFNILAVRLQVMSVVQSRDGDVVVVSEPDDCRNEDPKT